MNFEANAQNLQVLAGRLQETLSPEDQVRKDGKFGRTFLQDYFNGRFYKQEATS